MKRRYEAAWISLTGDRSINQDRVLMLSQGNSTLLCVADGLGGHPRGEVAAQLVVDVCETLFRNEHKPLSDPERFMMRCMRKAHQAILTYGDRQDPPISPRSTVVMALLQKDRAHWLHAGDSRLYLLRGGQVHARTHDHSQPRPSQPGFALAKPQTHVTRCLGGLDQPPVITAGAPTRLLADDILLLCSDGLWGQLAQERMLAMTRTDRPIKQTVQKLAAGARQQGAPRSDNISVLALRWRENRPAGRRTHVTDQPAAEPARPTRHHN